MLVAGLLVYLFFTSIIWTFNQCGNQEICVEIGPNQEFLIKR